MGGSFGFASDERLLDVDLEEADAPVCADSAASSCLTMRLRSLYPAMRSALSNFSVSAVDNITLGQEFNC